MTVNERLVQLRKHWESLIHWWYGALTALGLATTGASFFSPHITLMLFVPLAVAATGAFSLRYAITALPAGPLPQNYKELDVKRNEKKLFSPAR